MKIYGGNIIDRTKFYQTIERNITGTHCREGWEAEAIRLYGAGQKNGHGQRSIYKISKALGVSVQEVSRAVLGVDSKGRIWRRATQRRDNFLTVCGIEIY